MIKKYINISFSSMFLKIALCILLVLFVIGCISCRPTIQQGTTLQSPFDNIIPLCKDCIANVTWEWEGYESGKVGTVPLYIEDYGYLGAGVWLNIEDNYTKDKVVAKYERHCSGEYYLDMTIREFTNDYDARMYIEYVRKGLQEGNFTAVTQGTDIIPPEIENIPDDFFMYWFDQEPSFGEYIDDDVCYCGSYGDVGQSVWFRVGHYISEYNIGSNFDLADYIAWLRGGGETCRSCSLDLYSAVNETILRLQSEFP